jgi:hypothetical protein
VGEDPRCTGLEVHTGLQRRTGEDELKMTVSLNKPQTDNTSLETSSFKHPPPPHTHTTTSLASRRVEHTRRLQNSLMLLLIVIRRPSLNTALYHRFITHFLILSQSCIIRCQQYKPFPILSSYNFETHAVLFPMHTRTSSSTHRYSNSN